MLDSVYENLTDSQLILLVRENDSEAYRVLLERYKQIIKRIVAKYANSYDSDDLTQEANISFYYAAMFFDFQSSAFATFVTVCVERGVLTAVKKMAAKKRIPQNMLVSLDQAVTDDIDPERLLLDKEAHETVSGEIVERLSSFELSVLKKFLDSGSYEQTARELSVAKKSVDNALLRIRKKLDSLK